MQNTRSIPCKVCQSTKTHVMARLHSDVDRQDYRAVQCRQCGLTFTDPTPTLSFEQLQTLYGNNYTQEQRDISGTAQALPILRAATHRQMEIVEKYIPQGLALNVGAMNGAIKVLEERGWKLQVVEVSGYAANTARALWNFDVTVSRIEDFKRPAATFDFIKLGHVIEHLADPQQVIANLAGMLRPGGLILIDTDNAHGLKTLIEVNVRRVLGEDLTSQLVKRLTKKNLRKRYGRLTPPEHLFAFSEQSLGQLLTRAGFEIVEVFKPAWGDATWFPLADMKSFSRAEQLFIRLDQAGAKFGMGEVIAILARKK